MNIMKIIYLRWKRCLKIFVEENKEVSVRIQEICDKNIKITKMEEKSKLILIIQVFVIHAD